METENKKYCVLVVDDEESLRIMLQGELAEQGYNVLLAEDGKQALDIVYKNNVDAIVLDVMMPELNGYKVCEQLKTNRAYNLIPIIMLTAKTTPEDRITGVIAGADKYITKPYLMKEVIDALYELISLSKILKYQEEVESIGFFTIDSKIEYLQRVNTWIAGLYRDISIDGDVIHNLKLALDELGTNAIQHGNLDDENKKIIIEYIISRDKVIIRVEDEGEGFDFGKQDDDIESGIARVHQYVDELKYNKKGNVVTITKYLISGNEE